MSQALSPQVQNRSSERTQLIVNFIEVLNAQSILLSSSLHSS